MNEEITWSEYVLERTKKLFNSDDLDNEDVLEFVIQQAIKNDKAVHIEKDSLISFEDQWQVLVDDEENKEWHLCIFVSDTEESCIKWIKDNKLMVKNEPNG